MSGIKSTVIYASWNHYGDLCSIDVHMLDDLLGGEYKYRVSSGRDGRLFVSNRTGDDRNVWMHHLGPLAVAWDAFREDKELATFMPANLLPASPRPSALRVVEPEPERINPEEGD